MREGPQLWSYSFMKEFIFLVISALLFCQSVYAAEPLADSTIQQAQAKALSKERKAACAQLVLGLEAAKAQPKVKAKLVEALDTISTTFFTDKGQKLYESAQSVLFETPEIAIARLKEALVVEDQNLLINLALARAHLAKGENALAGEAILRARETNPLSGDAAVMELRVLVAQKSFEALRDKLKSIPQPISKTNEIFVKQFTAQDFWDQQMTEQAYDLLLKNIELDGSYPETYYFLAKTGAELSKNTDEWTQKYVTLCKSIDAKTRRKYANEPKLCANVKELEDELQKKNSEL